MTPDWDHLSRSRSFPSRVRLPTSKDGESVVLLRDVVDQLHDQDRLSYAELPEPDEHLPPLECKVRAGRSP